MTFWDRLKFVLESFTILVIGAWCAINGFYILTHAWF